MLQLEGITLGYGRVTVLDRLSCRAIPGVTLLTGANGAGKTTLLRLLATTRRPDAGVICWHGRPVGTDLLAFRRRLGYLPQREAAYPEMTVGQFLAYLADLKAIPRQLLGPRCEQLLEALGLTGALREPLGSLSEGQRRLVGVAQALLNDPDLLLLDEPFEGLDLESRHRVIGLMRRPGRITIVASHRLELALPDTVAEWRLGGGRLMTSRLNGDPAGVV